MDLTLDVETRNDTGKGVARKMRTAGQVPAVIYREGGAARPVAVDPKALLDIFRKTRNRNTVLTLQLDGASIPVMVKDRQRHPVSRELLHVDFYELDAAQPVVVRVPVNPVGRPKGAELGGRVEIVRRELVVRCLYAAIPEQLDVNVAPLDIGDMRKASELEMPEGVEHVYDRDFVVLRLIGRRAGKR